MKTGKIKKNFTIKPGIFFPAYFIVIALILVWNLTHCTEYSWKTANAFPTGESDSALQYSEENPVELKDGEPLTVRSAAEEESESAQGDFGKKPCLRGVALLGYENIRGLRFSGETISAEIVRVDTNESVGSGTLLLKNQTPYPNDETAVYIALSEPVTQLLPEELEVRFFTSGLTRNGIFAGGETAAEGEKAPLARFYYEKKKWNPLMSLVYFVLEAAAGLACLLLYGERKVPLVRGSRGNRSVNDGGAVLSGQEHGKSFDSIKIGIRAHKLFLPLLLLFFIVFLMSYTYLHVIRKTAAASAGDFMTGGSRTEEVVSLESGLILRQSVAAGQDDLSGIGILLVDEKGDSISSAKTAPYADCTLEWTLLDKTGTAILTSGSAQVKDLKKVKSLLSKDIADEALLAAANKSIVLPLDEPVREAKDKGFVFEISLAGNSDTNQNVYLLATGDTNGKIERLSAGTHEVNDTLPLEMCMLGTYKCNGFIKGMYLRMCAVLLVMLAALYYAALRFSRPQIQPGRQAALMYLVSALCMGMVFSFATPAYTISDERTHIDSVYILSNRILGINDIPGPKRLLKRACDIDTSIANTMPVTAERYRSVDADLFGAAPKGTVQKEEDGSSVQGGAGESAFTGRELTPAYTRSALENVPILCYLPSAIGFSAARLLGRNMITMIMMARWFNLLACILVMYLAVRRMPYGGAAMAVIGLFPKTLQQMASCSYDGMVIAGCFLLIALSLNVAFDKNTCIADMLALALTCLFAAGCKGGTYSPLLGMIFVIPAVRKGQGKEMRLPWKAIAGACVGGSVLVFAGKYVVRLLSMFGRESGTAVIAAGTKTLYTLSDFIHSPMKLVRIFINTITVRSDGILGELVGKNLSQKWYIVYAFLFLAFLGVLRRHSKGESGNFVQKNHFRFSGRIWFLFLAAASTALIFMSMLLAFTANSAFYIDGLQGRYFLPIAILPFLAAENDLIHREGIADAALVYSADVLLAVTICEIFFTYLGGA